MPRPPSGLSNADSPRAAAVQIVRVLREASHVAYFAGGCVRDELLGYHPKDYDIATDAVPDRVRELFPNSRFIGQAFGVVQVRIPHTQPGPGHTVEVATFRREWGYEDGRRPSEVHFTDAQTDAQRRDFTINGLFEDPLATDATDRIIDFVGGQDDLRAKLIRAIGDPCERFAEDYLRMLRAVRFAARLGFDIDPATAAAIPPLTPKLAQISRERIGQELMWMLTPAIPPEASRAQGSGADARAFAAITWLQKLHLDGPTLDEQHIDTDLGIGHTLAGAHSPAVGYATVLAAWMLDRHVFTTQDPAAHDKALDDHAHFDQFVAALNQFVADRLDSTVTRWRRALCLSNDHRDTLCELLRLLPTALAWSDLGIAKQKRLLANPCWPQARAILTAMTHHPGIEGLVASIDLQSEPLLTQGVAPQPWIDGEDLIAMGRKPGPGFRRLIELAYDAQLEGTLTSRQQALQWLQQQK